MSDNPPPVRIPITMLKESAEAKYEREQAAALYLLWYNLNASNISQSISEVTSNYQALVTDDIIHVTGTANVTFVNIADAIKEVTISANAGTTTLLGDATIESPTSLTDGQRATFYKANGQWWHK